MAAERPATRRPHETHETFPDARVTRGRPNGRMGNGPTAPAAKQDATRATSPPDPRGDPLRSERVARVLARMAAWYLDAVARGEIPPAEAPPSGQPAPAEGPVGVAGDVTPRGSAPAPRHEHAAGSPLPPAAHDDGVRQDARSTRPPL
jgi:hypothetical protein